MQRTFHILSVLVFLFGASYASPIATYDNQQVDQGIPVDFGDNADNDPLMSYTPTYYQLESPDTYPLLDNAQTNSAQNAEALSNQNQFEQVQQVDQTLYQPSAPTYVQSNTPDEDDTEDSSDDDNQPSCKRCQRRYRRRGYRGSS
ncbi:hypothetical protein K493DRAFT_303417 [Basidiobolus meristosporus CBS 931.73]|uniref:C2H2-type domain-containing protein n=1 Tax=Basidiobolus meristosporus CBS 931.73 TaxID=1314790 RepID=A0A1Y1Y356_9FUNG|nr:hypothetical protein K493DRAFT_362239 [Basidiobolus meristosporus CBS 931.73]ORX92315.1 hypothetical protein K493DRAFT_303417 [Basidiobolus meristosporus CBS 931.73]|eukprot:ORX80399.1 hypothetical protein K493DRAFT_362239 [Basidiobolus meristosporus CBS 931.73]